MGKYDSVRERTGWGVPGPGDTSRTADEIDELIGLTRDEDVRVRKVAVTDLCPCHVRADFPHAWDRIIEMSGDPSPLIRRAVVHMLADGSPRERTVEIAAVLESMKNDRDRDVRRLVNRVLTAYRKTGRINVL